MEGGIRRGVAVPIYNLSGAVVAAISVSGPAFRVTKEVMQAKLKDEVIASASSISRIAS